MSDERRRAVEQVMLSALKGQSLPSRWELVAAVSIGIETALAWRGDEVVRDGWVPVQTEGDVITGAHQHRYERELEKQLDMVLRYVKLRDGWIAQDDREALVEFRNLGLEVQMIAEARKIQKGIE